MSHPPGNGYQQPTHPPGVGYQQPGYGYQQQPGYPPPGGYQPFNHGGFMQTDVPNSGSAQTLGIVGIILFFNIIGIVCNILAIVKGNGAMREYNMYPGRYTEASFRKAKAGKTCGIVGLCLLPAVIIIIAACVAIAEVM